MSLDVDVDLVGLHRPSDTHHAQIVLELEPSLAAPQKMNVGRNQIAHQYLVDRKLQVSGVTAAADRITTSDTQFQVELHVRFEPLPPRRQLPVARRGVAMSHADVSRVSGAAFGHGFVDERSTSGLVADDVIGTAVEIQGRRNRPRQKETAA